MTAFVSLSETRQAAETVYGGPQGQLLIPAGWQLDMSFNNGAGDVDASSGGYVYALKPAGTDDGRRMLVFRGTETTLTNVRDVFADVTDIGKTQFGELRNVVNQWIAQELVAGRHVELVGHSSGGALVQWAINDTNMRDENSGNNETLLSVLERARTISEDSNFQISPNLLHFTTFNAPGITHVLGGATSTTDRTSIVVGEHHVVIGQPPIIQGDPIHLLGGPHVGGTGTQLLAHQVSFASFLDGLFTHTITKTEYWTAPVVAYTPPQLNVAMAQSFARHYSQLANTDGTVEGNAEAAFRLILYASSLGTALGVGYLAKQAEAATQLAELQFDRDVFADTLALPGDGINRALDMISQAADAAGRDVMQLQELVSSALISVIEHIQDMAGSVATLIENTLIPWFTDVAHGISNAVSDFLQDIPGTLFDLGRSLSSTDLNPFTSAYAAALEDRTLAPALRSALEDAQAIVQHAGQTVVVQEGIGPNPFTTSGFDPATAPLATGEVREDGANVFTAYLPYAAGTGGQAIQLKLNGLGASNILVLANSQELTPLNGTVTILVPEGQQQLVFVLRAPDVASNTTLSVNAVLVNGSGTATHVEQQEATVSIVSTDQTIDYNNGLPTHFNDYSSATVSLDIGPIGGAGLAFNEIVFTGSGDDAVFAHPDGLGNHQFDGGAGNDDLYGALGHDRLWGGTGQDWLVGGDQGDDVLDGGGDRDVLIARAGQDYLIGGGGEDLLQGGAGRDLLEGGADNDTLLASSTDALEEDEDYLDGGAGNDFLWGGQGDDVLRGGTENDRLRGDNLVDTYINLGWQPSYLSGRFAVLDPAMQFRPEGGIDYLDGEEGDDWLYGDGGDDVLIGGAGVDVLYGDDEFVAGVVEGDDFLDGGTEDDYLQGGGGQDVLTGGSGNDTLFGDYVGRPTLGTDDILDGGVGNDQLVGGGGNDTLFGGADADILWGDDGQDVLDGGAGNDELQGGTEADVLWGGTGNDVLFGEDGNDQLFGDEDNDVLLGEAGADELVGGAGDDQLQGGDGDDILVGGAGIDTLLGGLGADTYVFNLGDGTESIQDTPGEGNKIVFGAGISAADISVGIGSLVVRVGLTSDAIHIQGFDPATPTVPVGIDTFEFADGTTLTQADLVARGFDLVGTADHDVLDGGQLYQRIYGLDGVDSLTGGTGDNLLDGGAGNDTLSGLDGADTLVGGAGDDLLRGGVGDDTLDGGDGNDRLFGQSGTDQLYGGAGDDLLDAGTGADRLVGGAGNDIYAISSAGQEIVESANGGIDTVQPRLSGSYTYILPAEVENIELVGEQTTPGDFVGNQLDNRMTGSDLLDGREGNDTLIGRGDNIYVFGRGYGQDVIQTGTQSYASQNFVDYIQLLAGVAPTEVTFEGQGNHLVLKIAGTSDQIMVENYLIEPGLRTPTIGEIHFADGTIWGETEIASRVLVITGTNGNDTLTGFNNDNDLFGLDGNDQLVGYGGNDRLDGGTGIDIMEGGQGNDTFVVDQAGDEANENPNEGTDTVHSSITYTLGANVENLTLTGTAAINGTGNTLANVLTGNSAANVLAGGAGNDTYVVDGGDTVTEGASAGTDTVQSSVTWTLGANLEHLTLLGTAAINGTGNTLNNTLTGNSAANVLDGGTGNDTLSGGAGDDTYVVNATGDVVTELANEGTDLVQSGVTYTLAANVENLTLTGTTAINGTGNGLDNVLTGNTGNNVLTGGAGNDTYVVQNTGDSAVESTGAGTDTVQSSVTFTLGANIENLTLTGTAAINGTGNTLNNSLIGNSAVNTLNGGTGADAMTGGAGNDTYVVDATGDTVIEQANEGTDLVQSGVTYTLAANVENLTLTGTTAINGTGNGLDNVLTGNTGNNVLTGGAGNDTYVVQNTGDSAVEAASAGIDTVQSSVTWTLGANLENLTLTGTTAINGTGNALDNVLTGNSAVNTLTGGAGHDTLDGGTGNDTMIGGAGNDIYVVNATGDVTTEQANEGIDTVLSAVTRTLGANFENLTLTGTSAINATGNTLDNVLTGNSGNNVLTGGAGNDTYVVQNTGDSAVESAGAGTDTVQSSVTWTLGANLENLTLTGTTVINGTGNTLNNMLAGNGANNVLTGLGGNDTYQYNRGGGQDTVVDNSGTADTMQFGATIDPLDLVLSRQVNDLRLAIHGSADQVTIQNWYGGATNQTETIQAGNGQTLPNGQVDQLIQAMAQFTTDTGLSWDAAAGGAGTAGQQAQFQGILAANWQ